MSTSRIIALGMLLAGAVGSTPALAQTAQESYQQALAAERADGRVQDAIRLYERAIRQAGSDRALAARSLLRLGRAYETLGRSEARAAYERIVRDYADQSEQANEARTRLAALTPAGRRTAAAPPGPTARRVGDASTLPLGAPSPDGRFMSHTDPQTGDLAVRDLSAGTSRRITANPADRPWETFAEFSAMSPDGRQVAYAWFGDRWRFELRLTDVDRPQPRTLLSGGDVAYVQPFGFTPDGREVLVAVQRGTGAFELLLVSAATGAVRIVKSPLRDFPLRAEVSPDGRLVVFDGRPTAEAHERDLYVIAVTGGSEQALVQHPADDTYPMWAPNGRGVVFLSDRMGTVGAWQVDVRDGRGRGTARLVRPDMGRTAPMGLTRDRSLFYTLRTQMRNLYVAPVDLERGVFIEPPAMATQHYVGTNVAPDWSPDGRSIAFVSRLGPSSGPGSRRLCLLRLDTQELKEFRLPLRSFSYPRWSPDGRSILVSGAPRSGGHQGLYRVDVETGNLTPVVELSTGSGVVQAVWSRDGNAVYYVVYYVSVGGSSAGQALMLKDLVTGENRELYRPEGGGAVGDVSPSWDGTSVAFRSFSQATRRAEIKTLPARGGEARLVATIETPSFRGINWTPDGTSLLYFLRPPSAPAGRNFELWTVPASGGTPRKLELVIPPGGFGDVRLSPDGKHLLWSVSEGNDEIWVLEGVVR